MFSNFYDKAKNIIKEYYKTVIFFIICYTVFMFPLNLYIITGGGIMEVGDRIVVEDSKNKNQGDFNLAYVSEVKATVTTYLLSYIMKDWERVDVDSYTYSEKEDMNDVTFRGQIDLLTSNNNAIKNAFKEAGKSYKVTDTLLYVYYVDEESPNKFKVGDQILKVNDKEIKNTDDFKDIVESQHEDDTIDVLVKRNGKEELVNTTIYKSEDRLITGIYISSIYKYKTYPKVTFNFKSRESGPSGGLIEALTIYNKITEEDITHGKKIVGTGEIDPNGNILEIGGVKYKLLGAEKEKADIFLAPSGKNYETCKKLKEERNLKIEVVEVKTLKDAIEYLEGLKK